MKKKINNFLGRDLNKEREEDKISPQTRSKVMSSIHSRSTKFENDFIEKLKVTIDIDYDLNVNTIKGKPDIVFFDKKVCVFLDSDFWHGWQYPRWKHLLKNDFWREKIEKNRKRDLRTKKWLTNHEWKVIRIWEHNIKKDINHEMKKILIALNRG